jgi:hypothetical protein
MIGFVLALLGSKPAGFVGAGVSLLLVFALLASCATVKARDRTIAKITKDIAVLAQDLGTCRSNRLGLEASLRSQSASVAAFAEEQARRQREADAAAAEARRGREAAEAKAARLLRNQPQGVDECARVVAADRAVLEALR